MRAYLHTYGLQVTTSNCSNNYGPYHFPEKLIPLCITNILRGLPLPVYGDGSNIRDWLYVEDHCRGIELVLKRGEVGRPIISAATTSGTTWISCICCVTRWMPALRLTHRWPNAFPRRPVRRGSARELIQFRRGPGRARLALCHRRRQDHARTGL